MHRSSFVKMRAFRDAYLGDHAGTALTILDLGSAAVAADGASYRPLFATPPWRYCGLDLAPGPNVDLVVLDPYRWDAIGDASVDVVVSGQALEHIEQPWRSMAEVARVLRGNGLAAVTAPSAGPVHRYPRDCWRFYPDGLPALAASAGLAVVEQHWDEGYAFPENAFWGDAFAILQKPAAPAGNAPFGPLQDRQAIAGCVAAALAGINPWALKARLLVESMRRMLAILRVPAARLKRF